VNSQYIGINEARPKLGDLVTAVQQGADIVLTRNGKPAARIVRYQEDPMSYPEAPFTDTERRMIEEAGLELASDRRFEGGFPTRGEAYAPGQIIDYPGPGAKALIFRSHIYHVEKDNPSATIPGRHVWFSYALLRPAQA
jgi:prevent-host-death family protein